MIKRRKNIPVHDGELFTWCGDAGSTEVSCLESYHDPSTGWYSYVDVDSCDLGFYIVSPKTGRKVLFREYNARVGDGNIEYWQYRSTCGKFTVTVFND